MLSGDGDKVKEEEERLQVSDYLNRGTIDQVRVSMGEGSEDHAWREEHS